MPTWQSDRPAANILALRLDKTPKRGDDTYGLNGGSSYRGFRPAHVQTAIYGSSTV